MGTFVDDDDLRHGCSLWLYSRKALPETQWKVANYYNMLSSVCHDCLSLETMFLEWNTEGLNVKERVIEKLFIFVKILYYNCPTHFLTTIQSVSTSNYIIEYM